MKKTLIIVGGALLIIIIVAAVGFFIMLQGPDISEFEHLREPQISLKEDSKMLVVKSVGDPNKVAGKVFELLFSLYYQAEETDKSFTPPAPRARWPISLDTPKDQWVGYYALPVPEAMETIPDHEDIDGLSVSLETWQYGEVVEILHIGPYDKEEPDIKKINDFIQQQGYIIAGAHEEEYLKGPSIFGKGDPEEYATIIRYPVKKREVKVSPPNEE